MKTETRVVFVTDGDDVKKGEWEEIIFSPRFYGSQEASIVDEIIKSFDKHGFYKFQGVYLNKRYIKRFWVESREVE